MLWPRGVGCDSPADMERGVPWVAVRRADVSFLCPLGSDSMGETAMLSSWGTGLC